LLAGIKHLNRLENVLARREWTNSEIAEGLMLDMDGNAIEGTMSNLFLFQGKTLHTPNLGRCGVAGVQRERIMDLAGRLGTTVRVENLPLANLRRGRGRALQQCNRRLAGQGTGWKNMAGRQAGGALEEFVG
jgi:4-amino-4-deoxychorismate lyase